MNLAYWIITVIGYIVIGMICGICCKVNDMSDENTIFCIILWPIGLIILMTGAIVFCIWEIGEYMLKFINEAALMIKVIMKR
jgi:hypothetical protein